MTSIALSARAPGDPFAELRPALREPEALVEADRCLQCGGAHAPAPCVTACPADVDVPSFVAQIAAGEHDAAGRTILAENLLGATCARVCPVEVLCQGACVLPEDGSRAIEIAALQRFATDRALARGFLPRRVAPSTGRCVAVVGAGPAGLVCAGELAAFGHAVTVFDGRGEPGGLVRFAIAPYRQQRDPLPAEARMLAALGVEFRFGSELEPGDLWKLEREFDAVVVAVGMGADVDARYPGDGLPGVWSSLPFVEAIKTGNPPSVGTRAVVIGGGNTAVDVAREALRLGAEVTLVYRRTEADMPAYPHEVEEARDEGVRFEWLTVPVCFRGIGRLQAVECRRARLGDPDESGRRRPEEIPRSEFLLLADTAVLAIGQQPRTELLSGIARLETDRGLVRVDPETGQTGNPKVFAAGDALNGGATVVEAVRTAKIAARGVQAFLEERS